MFDELDLQSPPAVAAIFDAGAEANRAAPCREGSIDVIGAPGRLIATGDLHDNPVNFARLMEIAHLDNEHAREPTHLILHEVVHSDRLINGMDFSYRALARVAALKARFPERVHTLLANHELAQIVGAGIVKDGVRSVDAFNDALAYVFGESAPLIESAIERFVLSMPIALRCHTPRGDLLCAHSLPGPAMMARFDTTILRRELEPRDYEPRRGSAHLMVWGRGYDAEQLEDLVERWGINLFILGHEHAPTGYRLVPPCAVVLNSDRACGVYLPIDLSNPPRIEEIPALVRMLNEPGER